jgi:hypothetical protein
VQQPTHIGGVIGLAGAELTAHLVERPGEGDELFVGRRRLVQKALDSREGRDVVLIAMDGEDGQRELLILRSPPLVRTALVSPLPNHGYTGCSENVHFIRAQQGCVRSRGSGTVRNGGRSK